MDFKQGFNRNQLQMIKNLQKANNFSNSRPETIGYQN